MWRIKLNRAKPKKFRFGEGLKANYGYFVPDWCFFLMLPFFNPVWLPWAFLAVSTISMIPFLRCRVSLTTWWVLAGVIPTLSSVLLFQLRRSIY